ncbi:unnamed protein product [Lactuca saligna]|uniref:Uncharacterized protein n=1 Tax=Lactuca saligna TaxID=75948 RepID=A0AA35ZS18_LACSI|nr:unnamed protein product [Lactuca saligna]
MAGSSETTLFTDQSTSVITLNVKPGHNLILDLTASCYNEALRPMIGCFHFSPLAQALTMEKSIPLIHLLKALSTTSYVPSNDAVNFEVDSQKIAITKAQFCRMLGIGGSEGLVDPDSISSVDLIHMFDQMGYNDDLTLLSKFKYCNLPPMWNDLFTFLCKRFSERVPSSDSASKLFTSIIYGLYHSINLDYICIIWAKHTQSNSSTTSNTKFSCAWFKSIIIKRSLVHYDVSFADDVVIAISILQTSTFMLYDPTKFSLIGSIPQVILAKVPQDNVIVNTYRKLPSSGPRLMTDEMRMKLEEANKLQKRAK